MNKTPLPLFAVLLAVGLSACDRVAPLLPNAGCPRDDSYDRTPAFEVTVASVPTVIRHDVDLAGLAKINGTEAVGPDGKLQGLTVVEHQLSYKTGIAVTWKPLGGDPCAWVDKLTVDITPKSVAIFVPSDYPQDSCEYDQILAHERQHEETHRDMLAETAEKMRKALAASDALPARGTPLEVADRTQAEARIEAAVDAITKPVYADFKTELARRQAIIDLPENYRWVTRRCSSWK